jgi:hypothetical protein
VPDESGLVAAGADDWVAVPPQPTRAETSKTTGTIRDNRGLNLIPDPWNLLGDAPPSIPCTSRSPECARSGGRWIGQTRQIGAPRALAQGVEVDGPSRGILAGMLTRLTVDLRAPAWHQHDDRMLQLTVLDALLRPEWEAGTSTARWLWRVSYNCPE